MTTVHLPDTNASKVSAALVESRRHTGSQTVGVVLTLVIVAEEATHETALRSAAQAAREHPSRILVVIPRRGRGGPRLDAEIRVGELGPGDTVILRMYGPLAHHAESVVLPLLTPDNPVVVWWPGKAPPCPGQEPLGRLAKRRVTDAAAVSRPLTALKQRAAGYTPGDTDLSWTRLTPWRALLAAALDQVVPKVDRACVEGARGNPSVEVLAAWLETRLGIDVVRRVSKGPGLTAVELHVPSGLVRLSRPDGHLAQLDIPGSPRRPVGLRRRETYELLAEEMRRLDPDDIYEATIARFTPAETARTTSDRAAPKSATKKTAAKTAAARTARAATTKAAATKAAKRAARTAKAASRASTGPEGSA